MEQINGEPLSKAVIAAATFFAGFVFGIAACTFGGEVTKIVTDIVQTEGK